MVSLAGRENSRDLGLEEGDDLSLLCDCQVLVRVWDIQIIVWQRAGCLQLTQLLETHSWLKCRAHGVPSSNGYTYRISIPKAQRTSW